MKSHDLLGELSRQTGVDAAFNATGTARLVFDGRLAVDLESDDEGDRLHVYSVLTGLPADSDERLRLSEMLLTANLFEAGTGAARFAIDEHQGEVVLCLSLDLKAVDYQRFVAILEDFVDRLDYWLQRLDAIGGNDAVVAAETPPLGGFIRA
ncbi:MAG: type III secretion system chaperone [Gammaproteobacteria bacterium]|nr:type III secretion system chaperone [Gammaproteobacteria bacterium]